MKLFELLKSLSSETLIGVWNIDDKKSKCPLHQQYQKVGNIKWEKIRNIFDYDVFGICVNKENSGLLVRVHRKDRVNQSLYNYDLARKIANEIKRDECKTD